MMMLNDLCKVLKCIKWYKGKTLGLWDILVENKCLCGLFLMWESMKPLVIKILTTVLRLREWKDGLDIRMVLSIK